MAKTDGNLARHVGLNDMPLPRALGAEPAGAAVLRGHTGHSQSWEWRESCAHLPVTISGSETYSWSAYSSALLASPAQDEADLLPGWPLMEKTGRQRHLCTWR